MRLIPACWQSHGASKGKRREDDSSVWSADDHQCAWSTTHNCQEAVLTISDEAPAYRLTTSNPEEDLKRWPLTLDDSLTTTTDLRDPSVVQNPRYTHATLFSVCNLAITSIQAQLAHIRSLTAYAARTPYSKIYRTHDSAGERYRDLQASSFADTDREKLERRVLKAAHELRCLHTRAVHMSGCLQEFKVEGARGAEWVEIGDLLWLGAVGERWVREECHV